MELSPSQSRSSSVSDEVSSNRDDSYEKNQNKKQSKGEDEEQKVYKCKYCNKEFEHWQALGGHQNKHKEERFEAKWQKDFKSRLSAEQLERLLLFKQYEHILSGNTTRIAPLPPPPSYYSNLVAPHDSFDDYHQRRTSNEPPSTSHGGGGPTTGKGMRTNPPTKEEQIMRFDQLMKQHGMKRVTIKQNGSPVSLQGMKRIPITECRVKQIPMTQIGMKQSPMIAPQQRMGENPMKRRRVEDYHHNNPNENRRVDNNGGNRGDLFSKNKNSDAHGGNRGDVFSKGKSSEDFKALGLFREVAGMEDGGICLSDEDRVVRREEVDLTLKLCV